MTKRLTDEWVIADLGELVINAIPQNMILHSEPVKVLLKSGSEA
jgi:hypothetical protein